MNKLTKTVSATAIALTITGASIAVLANQKDHRDCDSDEAKLVQSAKLNIDQAMAIALADRPGKVIEAEIESDDGKTVWEIELVDNQNHIYEYDIDANNGAILESERKDY